MFPCPITCAIRRPGSIAREHATALALFSKLCSERGLHPAQAIRILRRNGTNIYLQLSSMSKADVRKLVNKVALRLESKNQVLTDSVRLQPEHFLTQTLLPTSLITTDNYVSPAIDVHPTIHFIRVQRHYNKRRYARVRAVSRPSFWAGMMLSTVMTGAFWGSTIQATDWLTTAMLVPDANVLIVLSYIFLAYRLQKLLRLSNAPFTRGLNYTRRGWKPYLSLRDVNL